MLVRINPHMQSMMFIGGLMALFMMVWVSAIPDDGTLSVKPWMIRLALGIYVVIFGYWIIDLFITTEKRGAWQAAKTRIALVVTLTVIFFVYPMYWYGTLALPTMVFAFTAGIVIPCVFFAVSAKKNRLQRLTPEEAEDLGRKSPEAKRFLERFPGAAAYVYGLSEHESERIHVLYQHRDRLPVSQDVYVDYCIDVPIEMRIHRVLGGTERLICYLFLEQEEGSILGMLSTSNIGRVLDVGYDQAELEDTYAEAVENGSVWPLLGSEPLPVRSFEGKVHRIR